MKFPIISEMNQFRLMKKDILSFSHKHKLSGVEFFELLCGLTNILKTYRKDIPRNL